MVITFCEFVVWEIKKGVGPTTEETVQKNVGDGIMMLYPRRRYTPRLHKIRAPLLLTSYSIITSVKIEKMTGFPYPWNHGHFHSQFYK